MKLWRREVERLRNPRPCACGRCGLRIPRTAQNRARRYAVECPYADAIRRAISSHEMRGRRWRGPSR